MHKGTTAAPSDYWEDRWSRIPAKPFVIEEKHHDYGRNGVWIRFLRRFVDLEGKSVLEVGGARSLRLVALAKWCGVKATALDFSATGLAQLQTLAELNNVDVEAILADVANYAHVERSFDFVLHIGIIEHLADPRDFLRSCWTLVSPGGHMIFSMPNMEGLPGILWKRYNPSKFSLHLYHDDESVYRWIDQLGSSDIRLGFLGFRLQQGAFAIQSPGAKLTGMIQYAFRLVERAVPWIALHPPRYFCHERFFFAHKKDL